ncbi:MAG TPA: ABC transporter ATP-binding protein [Solirubrobacteraceae bacterium]|nr:ABC transporter ATP-binding protein [Solirubrobacteraceae bacterium]
MTAVLARQLVKRFETTCALDAVDLRVQEGEVRGLLGPNGAGKTTLLRVLLGLVWPDAGSVELFGRALHGAGPLALDGVSGFVEDPSFYPYLSGRVNLELVAELDGAGAAARIDEVLEMVGLAGRGADRVNGYSSGMRQRLGIAACLLRSPRLLLLDEPTAGLDPGGVREMVALVRSLSADGTAIVLSSHQIGEVEDVCDSFTMLRRGRVVWDGTAAALQATAPAPCYAMATSDDARALEIAGRSPEIHAALAPAGGLEVTAERDHLDSFVLALGDARVAVRRLDLLLSTLESMFFALTGEAPTKADPGEAPTRAEPGEPAELAEVNGTHP